MRPETALYQLRQDPQTFLKNNFLIIAGSSRSGQQQCYITSTTDMSGRRDPGGPNESFKIWPSPPAPQDNPFAFTAINLRMIPPGEILNAGDIEALSVDGSSTADILVTGQLTGCAIPIKANGAQLFLAHIQPRNDISKDGQELDKYLQKYGRFRNQNGGMDKVFGRSQYSANATFVGIRQGGNWQLWAQLYTGANTSVQITKVVRII